MKIGLCIVSCVLKETELIGGEALDGRRYEDARRD